MMEIFKSKLCAVCKGRKLLCGRPTCPILERFRVARSIEEKINRRDIFGSSPPSIFVGEYGYPKVRIGPLVPPIEGNTSHLDSPLKWENKTIKDILYYRSLLVMGEMKSNVNVRKSGRLLSEVQELAMSIRPVDSEILLKKKPVLKVLPSEFAPPVGPKAELLDFELTENPKIPKRTDYVVNDELKAEPAIMRLYNWGFDEYYIIRLLSAGVLGINKKLVPTRWSITAVQDTIGKRLRKEILHYELINEFEVYFHEFLGNRYAVILMPESYAFELLEVWLKGSLFGSGEPEVIHDYEDFRGIKGYAEQTTGAYYAARLSVLEALRKRRRQARILVFREITPRYYAPVGVWQIRVGVKKAMNNLVRKFNTLNEALNEVKKFLEQPFEEYLKKSWILKMEKQRTLDYYLNHHKTTFI
ncbi:Nre family DNA repair protein [Thermococcus argininiproducens]|uniref:DNA repair protein n=1 Tax=Thermococcus argininiproducens TaxID=2866384 RepID=A0A9E7MB38_9EURY|nr:Nre family DNA repair protein [Thermococcus argininiproducens]USH00797.1 Nre family DNA repair protein [Thermococcus argininiproducens]